MGNEKLFRNDDNYRYFLRKMKEYILPVAQLWTYFLMRNHFHLIVKIRAGNVIEEYFKLKKGKDYNPTTHPRFYYGTIYQLVKWLRKSV